MVGNDGAQCILNQENLKARFTVSICILLFEKKNLVYIYQRKSKINKSIALEWRTQCIHDAYTPWHGMALQMQYSNAPF